MLTCTSLFSRFSSNAHHHGSLPQQLEGGLRPAPESRSRGAFPHLSRSLFTRLVHNELLIRVLLQHTEAEKVENGVRTLRELARSYRAITQDLTRVMNRLDRSKNRDREEEELGLQAS